jgi:hypothetical protein
LTISSLKPQVTFDKTEVEDDSKLIHIVRIQQHVRDMEELVGTLPLVQYTVPIQLFDYDKSKRSGGIIFCRISTAFTQYESASLGSPIFQYVDPTLLYAVLNSGSCGGTVF